MKEEDCHRDGTRRHRRCHRPKNSEDIRSQAGGVAVREEVMEEEEVMEALQVELLPMEEVVVVLQMEEEEFGQEIT